MEAFGPFLDGYANVHIQLWEYLRAKTFSMIETHNHLKATTTTARQVSERANIIRHAFIDSLGGLPESHHPLNARVKGRLQRSGYRIEKIIYESQPKVYVTALLYVPDKVGSPAPGILFVSGHHREAKGNPEYQRVCHDLVTNGFVVLATDPTGQGERVTHLDPETGEMAIGWGTTEHSYHGQQCVLTGTSIARYFLHDAMRGIDLLQSRPEVDPERIGVTGNSGGGTQTSLLCMSGDKRIKAAAPCTYVTSREHYYMTGQPQDLEQIQFAMTSNGINFDDFFIPIAPRPLLIGAVSSDFFNPEGTELVYQRLRRVYDLLGQGDAVARVFAPGRHMYCRELREAVVNWFRRHLLGQESSFVSREDGQIDVLADSDLWCTTKGHVLSDFPDAQTPYHLNLEQIPKQRAQLTPRELRWRVIDALAIRERTEYRDALYPRTLKEQEENGTAAHSIFFCSEPDIMVTGCLFFADGKKKERCTLLLANEGTRQLERHHDTIQALLREGDDVFVVDVRGTGWVFPHPINPCSNEFPVSHFNTQSWFAMSAYCLGECLMGMRVFDVLRAAEYLRDDAGYSRVGLCARGLEPALWGYLAAALDPAINPVRVEGLIESFEAIARTQLYRTDILPPMLIHGVLQVFDLPDLMPLFDGRSLELTTTSVALEGNRA